MAFTTRATELKSRVAELRTRAQEAANRANERYRGLTRRQRQGAGAVGAAALVAAVVGPLAAPAAAAVTTTVQNETGLTQALAVSGSLSDGVDDQADAQEEAADSTEGRKSGGDEERKSAEDGAAEKPGKSEQDEKDEKAEKAEKKAEEERGGDQRSDRTSSRAKLNAFVSPMAEKEVTTQYNSGGAMWSSGSHSGIDFAAPEGESVQSVGAGTVVEAGWGGAYGNNIVVKHDDGHFTQYGHLSAMDVSVGQSVTSGQDIGRVGSTGNSTGPHLHFEARTAQAYGTDVNPIDYLRGKGVGLG